MTLLTNLNKSLMRTVLESIGLAMGISTLVLNYLEQISQKDSIIMLCIGLTCLSLSSLLREKIVK